MTEALDLLAGLVLEDGRRWGEAAVDVQWEDARAILTGAEPYHFWTRARGYSKTTDLAGVALAALCVQLPDAARAYAIAADREQGTLLLDAFEGFVARTPELGGAFSIGNYKIEATRTHATLEVMAADASSAYGLRPALIAVDEICQWKSTREPRRMWEAISSAASKNPACRMALITTAGDPAHWSKRDILDHARSDPLWRVHEVEGPSPWMSEDRLEEQRRRLPDAVFSRLFLNQWTSPEDRLTTEDDLAACVTLDGPLAPVDGVRYVAALDVGIVNDRTAFAVCHQEPLPDEPGRMRIIVDHLDVWTPTRENPVELDVVESSVEETCHAYRAPLVFDPHQAKQLTQRLRSRGIRTQEFAFSQQSVSRLAITLHNLIRKHMLAIPNDRALVDELANVRLRETATPGVYRLDHDAGRHDDRAIAIALAAQHLLEVPKNTMKRARVRFPAAPRHEAFASTPIVRPGRSTA